MRNTRPADLKKMIQGLIILTLLCWATQTLVSQWAFGDEITGEKFVAPSRAGTLIELKSEATINGNEIRLNQIVRWPGAGDDVMEQTGDLIVGQFGAGKFSQAIDLDDVKTILEGAGVNLASVDFSGALRCVVTRSDQAPVETVVAAPTAQTTRPIVESTSRSLRDILIAEVAERFALSADSLQVRFSQQDEKVLNLPDSNCKFDVEPRKQRNIGDITWDVTVTGSTGRQKHSISAHVRAWQTQIIAVKPIVTRQVISESDVTEKRVLVDRLPDEGSLTLDQVVGQQSARDISPGVAFTGRMIEAVQLAKVGQLINVLVQQGRVQLKWVAEARESGAYGQTIRVRKPGTREEFSVLLSGPQQGKLISSPSNVALVP
ncbi:MAG TPA: flagellar basal body P-ring formation chaperone FlgA [Tepidisphaeraceae bacterium]|jgi:flagella basal body P-ring formation protein FlgA|nr:flagellar basal body P-ring formation chaperone FlgA [Tepidisphaeraceae bacterium]